MQSETQNKVMCKYAVIYESRERLHKGRTKLLSKTIVTVLDGFNDKLLDTLYTKYDMDKIEKINIIGDGANWIKYMPNTLRYNGISINSYLD